MSSNIAVAQEFYINNMPDSVSNIYSDVDMRVRLANKPNEDACAHEQCALNAAFDAQVQELGGRLAIAAYKLYPDIKQRVSRFSFSVMDKKEAGLASNVAGRIVVFRGIQRLELSEDALAFLIAREMGHVIGRHHDKNTSTKIIISVLASVLFPVISIFTASNVAAQASNVTSLVTGAATTATSYVGSEVVLARVKPSQLKESDDIALQLLEAEGRDIRSVTSVLQQNNVRDGNWSKDLQITAEYLDRMLVKVDAAMEIEHVADKNLK
ncbi:MAG TPA: M48 family metalloprotease [Methylotenera sp.]|nr:M48 family metalloprotease [Methylotenera sp.]